MSDRFAPNSEWLYQGNRVVVCERNGVLVRVREADESTASRPFLVGPEELTPVPLVLGKEMREIEIPRPGTPFAKMEQGRQVCSNTMPRHPSWDQFDELLHQAEKVEYRGPISNPTRKGTFIAMTDPAGYTSVWFVGIGRPNLETVWNRMVERMGQ